MGAATDNQLCWSEYSCEHDPDLGNPGVEFDCYDGEQSAAWERGEWSWAMVTVTLTITRGPWIATYSSTLGGCEHGIVWTDSEGCRRVSWADDDDRKADYVGDLLADCWAQANADGIETMEMPGW